MTVENTLTAFIDTSIAGMTTASDYNYDYADVNEYKPDDKTYPNVKSNYMVAEAQEVIVANKYTANLNAEFMVTVDNSADVDVQLDKVVEDFKRLFDDQHSNLQTNGMIWERYIGKEKTYRLNKYRPGSVLIRWLIRYRVDMDDPSST